MNAERPLNPFERWMVAQNIKYVQTEGVEPVVAQLLANGYDRVARAVEKACAKA